jgi:hypothetical protein
VRLYGLLVGRQIALIVVLQIKGKPCRNSISAESGAILRAFRISADAWSCLPNADRYSAYPK